MKLTWYKPKDSEDIIGVNWYNQKMYLIKVIKVRTFNNIHVYKVYSKTKFLHAFYTLNDAKAFCEGLK